MGISFSSEERQLLREASPDQYLERERLILAAMQTEKGRQLLAQETVPYVRMTLDYQSIARKIFMLDEYEQGASLTYDKEATSRAYILSKHGEVITEEAGEDTFDVQPFEIVANPRVRKMTYRRRRYAMLDTLQKRGSEAIYKEEDIKAFSLMKAALLPANTQIVTGGALTKNGLTTAFETIEEQYLAPATCLLDPKAMGDFRELDFGYGGFTEATHEEMERSSSRMSSPRMMFSLVTICRSGSCTMRRSEWQSATRSPSSSCRFQHSHHEGGGKKPPPSVETIRR